MRIDFLLLADAAEVSNGKLYLLGGAWDLFQAPVFPTVTRVGVAVGVLFEKHEIDRLHRLSLKVSEVNGHDLLPPLEVELRPQPRMVSTESIRALFAINPSLQIPGPGIFEVKAKIGEWEQAERFQAIVRSETASSGMEGTP